jgi:hypothetical protein
MLILLHMFFFKQFVRLLICFQYLLNMHSDTRMSVWWKENTLEDTIRDYVTSMNNLKPGHDYEPSTFLQHLDAQGKKNYLHYGVNSYVRELYKDYNGVGHYALFKQTEKKVIDKHQRYNSRQNETPKRDALFKQTEKKVIDKHRRYNSRQNETPKRDEFEIALDAAKKAAEDRDKKLKLDKLTSEVLQQQKEGINKTTERKDTESEVSSHLCCAGLYCVMKNDPEVACSTKCQSCGHLCHNQCIRDDKKYNRNVCTKCFCTNGR